MIPSWTWTWTWILLASTLVVVGALGWVVHQRQECRDVVASPEQEVLVVGPQGRGTACTWECPCAFKTGMQRLHRAGEMLLLRGGTYMQDKRPESREEMLP